MKWPFVNILTVAFFLFITYSNNNNNNNRDSSSFRLTCVSIHATTPLVKKDPLYNCKEVLSIFHLRTWMRIFCPIHTQLWGPCHTSKVLMKRIFKIKHFFVLPPFLLLLHLKIMCKPQTKIWVAGGVNFINILRTAFPPIFLLKKVLTWTSSAKNYTKNLCTKSCS